MAIKTRLGTITIAVSGTTAGDNFMVDGQLGHLVVNVPALTGTGTVTIVGTTANGGTLYPIATQVESGEVLMPPVGTPTYYNDRLYLTVEETSGTQDAAASITYKLFHRTENG